MVVPVSFHGKRYCPNVIDKPAAGSHTQDTSSTSEAVILQDAKAISSFQLDQAGTRSDQDARPDNIEVRSLDPDGNCRINTFTTVPEGNTFLRHPYSRCYIVESTSTAGAVRRTSGYALSSTRVITSDVHYGARTIKVSRAFTRPSPLGGPTLTTFDSEWANAIRTWDPAEKQKNIGLRYAILGMAAPLNITDGDGDNNFTTITSVLSITRTPELLLLTRRVPSGELVTDTSVETPWQITFGTPAAEWFNTHLGGYIGRGSDDYMLGSPIFVTSSSTTLPGGGTSTSQVLVGLVTDEIVATSPCSVNAGLFTDPNGVNLLLAAF
jgi:hypothetical protein